MDNRREAARLRTLKGGKMVFNDGMSVLDCMVRDMSETGAKLKVTSVVGIPDRFSLLLEGEKDGHRCRVVRRDGTTIGVAFERI